MNKLLRAGFARLAKSRIFWICTAVSFGIGVISSITRYREMMDITGYSYSMEDILFTNCIFMPIFSAVFAGLFIGTEYSDGTIRNKLIAAARKGDEDALETLTLEDMDIYTSISKKIHKEDIFSLVDTYFMPYGVECDQYSVLGEIMTCKKVQNQITGEEIYLMTISCNELTFDVCINIIDIFGEPKAGRRFKGIVWLQGYINFPEDI